MEIQIISIIVAILALTISALTAWFSWLHRGTIKMTQPTVIFFGPDGTSDLPKIFLRTLLFSTSARGQVIENMHIKLERGESAQNFNIWVYGETNNLARGSGLFISKGGVSCNHHFLLPKDGATYEFLPGDYILNVFVSLLGKKRSILLFTQKLSLSKKFADDITNENSGVYFDWGPDSKSYHAHLDENPNKSMSTFLRKGIL
jgi:hypothetical protein